MAAKLLSLLLSFLALTGQLNGQAKSKRPTDCRKIVVQDNDRHSFDDQNSFTTDIDGDGRPDTIIPRTYTRKAVGKQSGRRKAKAHEAHWIAFDAKTSKGGILKSFFKYKYGTDEADYWAYAFVPCYIHEGRRSALMFYAGDDTSDETIILERSGKAFVVHQRKVKSAGL